MKRINLLFLLVFLALSIAEGAFRFVQLADPQLGRGGYQSDAARLRQAVRQINGQSPAFVLICGDLVDITENTAGYAELKGILGNLDCPAYMIPGNHDVGNEPSPASLEQYRKTVGTDYFSFNHKDWSFVGVDTQLMMKHLPGESEAQMQWLTNVLQQAESGKIVMFGHVPIYKVSPDEANDYYNLPPETRSMLPDLLVQHGVKAYLSGHTHARIINDYQGMQLVTAVSTSLNRDDNPYGYRMWTVADDGTLSHEFVELEDGGWNAGPTVSVEVRGLKSDESSLVALLMGNRDEEWDFDKIRKVECETVSKNYLVNATPVGFKLLEEGEATAVAGAYRLSNGKLERLRFASKSFVARAGATNKVMVEFKDEVAATYTNPLDVPVADPFVFHEDDVYYLYGTDDQGGSASGVPVLVSTDLVNWENKGYAFSPDETTWSQCNYWGPEMAKVGDDYYLYFNASPNKFSGRPFNMHLCIAKGKSPLGPFKEFKVPFYKPAPPEEAIDQNVFIDDDGQAYLVITQVIPERNDIRVVRLKDNMVEFDGEPVVAVYPTQEWECRPTNGHLVNEGGALIKHEGYYYLTYTGNSFTDPNYAIGYATSKSPMGPWTKYEGNPILSKTEAIEGPGNGMFVKSPDGKELFIVYHTHFKPGQVGPRKVAIDRVRFKDVENGPDILVIDGPTSTPQPMPSGVK
ncbi:MAG: family 43 glycosylhydrolase [Verrucomicrobiota bacterium]